MSTRRIRAEIAPQAALTNADNIELETALQELLLNLRCDAVETNVAPWIH